MSPKMGERWGAKRRRALITAIDAIRIDDDPTSYNSATIEADLWQNFLLYLDIDSTLSPTTLQVIVQFSDDGGTTWYSYFQDLFASLFYEDTDTASGITECFSGQVQGRDMRVRIVGVGTDATNYFDVTAKVELWA